MARPKCICGCGQRSANLHHIIYRQHVARAGGNVRDKRNLVPVAFSCHGAHHGRSRPLELGCLPDGVFEFAGELLGPAGFDYLRRRYRGEDERLEALLSL